MTAYLTRMPAGIAGAISRPHDSTTEPALLQSSATFTLYGLAGKYSGNFFVPLAAGDTVDKIVGFYVRPFPTTLTPDLIRQVGTDKNVQADILKRGYLSVNLGADASAVVKGSAVYVRVGTPTTASPLGSVLAAADSANTVQLTNAYFTGAGDAAGNTEIAYNL